MAILYALIGTGVWGLIFLVWKALDRLRRVPDARRLVEDRSAISHLFLLVGGFGGALLNALLDGVSWRAIGDFAVAAMIFGLAPFLAAVIVGYFAIQANRRRTWPRAKLDDPA